MKNINLNQEGAALITVLLGIVVVTILMSGIMGMQLNEMKSQQTFEDHIYKSHLNEGISNLVIYTIFTNFVDNIHELENNEEFNETIINEIKDMAIVLDPDIADKIENIEVQKIENGIEIKIMSEETITKIIPYGETPPQ